MRKLFLFFIRFHFFFLFLILEAIAFSFILQNHYHHSVIVNTTGNLSGKVYEFFHEINEYFYLRKANEHLLEENTRLRFLELNLKQSHEPYLLALADSNYSLISCKVLSSTISKQKNYVLIDKGSNHGIDTDMGVISPKGIVGIVVEVSENYSLVMPSINIQSSISAKIKRLNQKGNLNWRGKDYRTSTLLDIPSHVSILHGDTIISSGYSHVFPEGVPIGLVNRSVINEKSKFYESEIELFVDFNNLYFVYVLKNNNKTEILEIQDLITDE